MNLTPSPGSTAHQGQSRFALIYADLVVLAHTNEFEYNSYFGNKENEAMIDRIFVVKVPYNLRLSEEIKIYEKLIGQSQLVRRPH